MPVMTDEGQDKVTEVVTAADEAETVVVDVAETVGADEAATVGADEAGTDDAGAVATTGSRRRWVLPVAAGLAGALLACTAALGWQVWQQHQIQQASQQAQRAAVSYAQVLTSIDSNKVDENFKEVLDGATGEFKDMYSQSSVELRQLLIENKATAHGVVVDSAVQEVSKDKAVVLLFIDQSVTNSQLPDPRIDRSRMKMTLEMVDGRWRASKVELP